jgi:hypothetical protein
MGYTEINKVKKKIDGTDSRAIKWEPEVDFIESF